MNRLLNYVKAAGSKAMLRADAFRWQHQLSRLANPGDNVGNGEVVFCDVVGSYAVSKAQSLYSVVFRQLGHDSIVLLDRPYRDIERNYRAAGVNQFFYLSELSPDPKRFRAEAEALISQYNDTNDIMILEIDGVRVGRNVLSKAVRRFRVGRLNSRSSDHRSAILEYLCYSLATIEGARRFFSGRSVRAAFFCERGYTPAGEVFDVCTLSGIDAIQWLGAPIDRTLLFKRYRENNRAMHPLSLSEKSWVKARGISWSDEDGQELMNQLASHYETGAWYNRQQLQNGKALRSRQAVQEELGLDPKKKTAVIFCHIFYDATFFYGNSLFIDYQTWLIETVRSAIANPGLNWVVKAHPVNVWRSQADGAALEPLELHAIQEALGELPGHVRFMPADTPTNTFSLFQVADYGLTVRGTIGLELPCFGIPVVTAGTGRYSGNGFTMNPETPQAYRALLARLQDIAPLDEATINLARRYAYATLNWRPLPLESFEFQFGLASRFAPALRSNVRLEPDCPSDLTATPDLGRMAKWALDSSDDDLLAPESHYHFKSTDGGEIGAMAPMTKSAARRFR